MTDERYIRKGEIVHVCDGSDSGAVQCDVTERSVVERLVTIPIHSKHGGVTLRGIQCLAEEQNLDKTYTKPVAAVERVNYQENVQKGEKYTHLISASPA